MMHGISMAPASSVHGGCPPISEHQEYSQMMAFLNAELSDEVTILTQPAPELVQFVLVKPGTLYQCTKACYSLREAPKLWEESRDKTLTAFHFVMDGDTYSLRQSVYHPSLWFVVKTPCLTRPPAIRLPDESDLPDLSAFGECVHLAAILVYVDDFLAVGTLTSFTTIVHTTTTSLEGKQSRLPWT